MKYYTHKHNTFENKKIGIEKDMLNEFGRNERIDK